MKYLTIGLAGLAVAGLALTLVKSYYTKREKEALEAELEGLTDQLVIQQRVITKFTSKTRILREKVKAQKRQLAVNTEENSMLLRALDSTHEEIRGLTSRLADAERKYNNLQERFENMKNKLIIKNDD